MRARSRPGPKAEKPGSQPWSLPWVSFRSRSIWSELAGHRGFTLIETMIVVAIVAIAFAIGVPSFVQIVSKGPLRQALSDVMEALGQARAQAILRGVPVEFTLTGEGGIEVLPLEDPKRETQHSPLYVEEGDSTALNPPPKSAFSARLHRDIAVTLLEVNFRSRMEAPVARVRFFPNGTSDDFTLVLEEGGQIKKISLDPITALADLETLR